MYYGHVNVDVTELSFYVFFQAKRLYTQDATSQCKSHQYRPILMWQFRLYHLRSVHVASSSQLFLCVVGFISATLWLQICLNVYYYNYCIIKAKITIGSVYVFTGGVGQIFAGNLFVYFLFSYSWIWARWERRTPMYVLHVHTLL